MTGIHPHTYALDIICFLCLKFLLTFEIKFFCDCNHLCVYGDYISLSNIYTFIMHLCNFSKVTENSKSTMKYGTFAPGCFVLSLSFTLSPWASQVRWIYIVHLTKISNYAVYPMKFSASIAYAGTVGNPTYRHTTKTTADS